MIKIEVLGHPLPLLLPSPPPLQLPHPNLYDFKGRMEVWRGVEEEEVEERVDVCPLTTEHLLLRGSTLAKGAGYVVGETLVVAM